MQSSQMSAFLQHLRATLDRDEGEVRDGELLTRFLKQRDDTALAALVHRHAQMVWGVCCRLLRNRHDAEDAFQATFLVLVRKAATVQDKELVANWLYGVAHQTAVRLRGLAVKQSVREKQVMDMPEPALAEPQANDLLPLLDLELSRLPEQFRALIVLCDLEGKTRKQAALQLGCPEGTIASRLVRARALLAKRFARHGIAVSETTLAVVLSANVASASAPASVVISTIKAASLLATGQAVASGLVSAKVVAVTEGVVKAMLVNKLKGVLSVLFVGGMVLGGVGVGVGLSNGPATTPAEGTPVATQELVAFADPPPAADAQKAAIEEQLRRLTMQLKELESKNVGKPTAPQPKPPVPPTPTDPLVAGPQRRDVLLNWAYVQQPVNNAVGALQGLLQSNDPKVVAQARELLALLSKTQPIPPDAAPLRFAVTPSVPGAPHPAPKAGMFELPLDAHADPKPMVVYFNEAARMTATAAGPSALRLSTDGKTAAVVSADGSITIFDVASGKEQMKFPAKK